MYSCQLFQIVYPSYTISLLRLTLTPESLAIFIQLLSFYSTRTMSILNGWYWYSLHRYICSNPFITGGCSHDTLFYEHKMITCAVLFFYLSYVYKL